MVKKLAKSSLLLGLLLSASCNFQESKGEKDQGFGSFTNADLNFASVQSRIITPYCLSCHANATGNLGGINLETYEAVSAIAAELQATVVDDKTMPPRSARPLPSEGSAMMEAWLKAGAPE